MKLERWCSPPAVRAIEHFSQRGNITDFEFSHSTAVKVSYFVPFEFKT